MSRMNFSGIKPGNERGIIPASGRGSRPGIGRGSSTGMSSKYLQSEFSAQGLKWRSMKPLENLLINISTRIAPEAWVRIIKHTDSNLIKFVLATQSDSIIHIVHLDLTSGLISHAVQTKFMHEPKLRKSLPEVDGGLIVFDRNDIYAVPANAYRSTGEAPASWASSFPKRSCEGTAYVKNLSALVGSITQVLQANKKKETLLLPGDVSFLSALLRGLSTNLKALSS